MVGWLIVVLLVPWLVASNPVFGIFLLFCAGRMAAAITSVVLWCLWLLVSFVLMCACVCVCVCVRACVCVPAHSTQPNKFPDCPPPFVTVFSTFRSRAQTARTTGRATSVCMEVQCHVFLCSCTPVCIHQPHVAPAMRHPARSNPPAPFPLTFVCPAGAGCAASARTRRG